MFRLTGFVMLFLGLGRLLAADHSAVEARGKCKKPKIKKLIPSLGAPGDVVTIKGKKFGKKPGLVLFGGDQTAEAQFWSGRTIRAWVPEGAINGHVTVLKSCGKASKARGEKTWFRTAFCVPDDFPTIQAALDGVPEGMTIIVRDGTYTGAGNRDLDFSGKGVTLRSENGPSTCIVDCQEQGRGFYFHSGEGPASVVSGLTITNGRAESDGGGIYCEGDSSPTIADNVISGNSAYNGGGIYCGDGSSPAITSNSVGDNSASLRGGGGIYCGEGSSPTITNNAISGNSGGGEDDGSGGGIYCIGSSPTITDNTISGNLEGGICCFGCSPTITNNTISDNSVSDTYSGGIYCGEGSSPTITGNIISGNLAPGIYCVGSSPTITDNTISGNSFTAPYAGGGIYCLDSSPAITKNIIRENSVTDPSRGMSVGGGIYCGGGSSPTITGNTIGQNSVDGFGGGIYCGYGSSPTITDNTISENSVTGTYGDGGGIYCSNDCSVTITNNTIRGNSVGDTIYCDGGGIYCSPSCAAAITDNTISGNSAFAGGGIYCEWQSSPAVAITNNTISENSSQYGGGIVCGTESSPAITNNAIARNSAFRGGGIDCWNQSVPTITDNTISENSATSGGGISCWFSDSAITNNAISANSADGDGGGVCCVGSSPTITNNTMSGNLADGNGGGVCCHGSRPTITNNTISGNSADDEGGGIYCSESEPTIVNSVLWGNLPQEVECDWEDDPSTLTISYSDVQGGQEAIVTNDNATVNWGEGNIDADPLFAGAGNFHLRANSPCINAGDNAAIQGVDTDMDGEPRIAGGRVDMGADEYHSGEPETPGHTYTASDANGDVRIALDSGEWLVFHIQDVRGDPIPDVQAYLYKDSLGATIIAWDPSGGYATMVYSTNSFRRRKAGAKLDESVTLAPFRTDQPVFGLTQVIPNHIHSMPREDALWDRYGEFVQDTREFLEIANNVRGIALLVIGVRSVADVFNPVQAVIMEDIRQLIDFAYYTFSPTEQWDVMRNVQHNILLAQGGTAPTTANLAIKVKDGQGIGIGNATVDVTGPSFVVAPPTLYSGWTEVCGLAAGSYEITISHPGYTEATRSYVVTHDLLPGMMQFTLTPAYEFKVTLDWGAEPQDLDIHTWTPVIEGRAYHIYSELFEFGDQGDLEAAPYVHLEKDMRFGYGDEEVVVSRLFGGTYYLAIHNYSQAQGDTDVPLAESGARIVVRDDSGFPIRTVTAPTAGSGLWWDVLRIDGATGETTIINSITDSPPQPWKTQRAGLVSPDKWPAKE